MNHRGQSVVSPISEVPTHVKPRKTASTGGNRSWSEEEETYLLQTRMQKMPYKHIAAHLKKTELACRLHFHQLSHGSHRRKRAASMSSHTSSESANASPYLAHQSYPETAEYAVIDSRQSSPMSYTSHSTPPQSIHASPAVRYQSHHKVLLPKPSLITPRHSSSPEPHGLRINTSDAVIRQQQSQAPPQNSVDTDRLRHIYESRRASFWTAIAAEYGSNISPAQLEDIWRQGGALRPPTPEHSPDGSMLKRPTLQPSPFAYPSAPVPVSEQGRGFAPANHYHHHAAAPVMERPQYTLPPPQPSAPRFQRTWSSTSAPSNMPIAAILNEDSGSRR